MSGEASVEVSVPTDLTVTNSEIEGEDGIDRSSSKYARQIQQLSIEKNELKCLVEKLKLELENKEFKFQAAVNNHRAELSNIVLKKDDLLSVRQSLINKLQLELSQRNDELNLLRERAARELAQLAQKCSRFQDTQKRLEIKHDDVKNSLLDLQISEEDYTTLKHLPSTELSLGQFAALRVYELVMPHYKKIYELKAVQSSLENVISANEVEIKTKDSRIKLLMKALEEEKSKSNDFATQCMSLQSNMRTNDFRVLNFDRIKDERNKLENEKINLEKKYKELELSHTALEKEKEFFNKKLSELQVKVIQNEQENKSLMNDKNELKDTISHLQEEVRSLGKQIQVERELHSSVQKKYMDAQNEISKLAESFSQTKHELISLKERFGTTALEGTYNKRKIEHLKQQSEYEHSEALKLKLKYEKESFFLESKINDLSNNLASVKNANILLSHEADQLREEVSTIKKVHYQQQSAKDKEMLTLQHRLLETEKLLGSYQELEKEVSSKIKWLAQLPESENTEFDKLSPEYFLLAGRSEQQVLKLTKEKLFLERQNKEALTTVQKLTDALSKMKEIVLSYKAAINMADKPIPDILEQMALLREQLCHLKAALSATENINKAYKNEKENLLSAIDRLKQGNSKYIEIKHEIQDIKVNLLGLQKSLNVAIQEK